MIKIIEDLGSIYPENTRSNTPRKRKHYLVECACGKQWKALAENVNAGKTTMCKQCQNNIISESSTKHGGYVNRKPTRLMSIYKNMVSRCYNIGDPAYPNYGAKGVTICDEWLCKNNGFKEFSKWATNNGYTDTLTIDKDKLCEELFVHPKKYSPETCQWMTKEENSELTTRLNSIDKQQLIDDYVTKTLTTQQLADKYDYTFQGICYILQVSGVYRGKNSYVN